MGSYSDKLQQRILQKRLQNRFKWPKGFKGMIMWCPKCSREIARAPEGQPLGIAQQKLLVDAHNKSCPRQRLKLVEQPSGE